jgi:predicted cupin superfamily sugar epimerase
MTLSADASAWHRVASDEVWLAHEGSRSDDPG